MSLQPNDKPDSRQVGFSGSLIVLCGLAALIGDVSNYGEPADSALRSRTFLVASVAVSLVALHFAWINSKYRWRTATVLLFSAVLLMDYAGFAIEIHTTVNIWDILVDLVWSVTGLLLVFGGVKQR